MILKLKYEDSCFYDSAVEALERTMPFDVVISGMRARIIMKARPLSWLLFDNPQQPIKSKRPTVLRLFVSYLLLSPTFWGVRFLALRAGMKETWAEQGGILMVSFRTDPIERTSS